MRSNELRTGNIILRLGNESIVDWSTIKLCHQRNKQFNEDWKPIPLTHEWLERFDFDRSEEITGASGIAIKFDVHRKDGFTFNSIQDAYWYNKQLLINQPKYVHQLQNLYFALTGKELELK